MLTKTTETAMAALIVLATEGGVIAPHHLAQRLGASPSYLSKIAGLLVKAGILRSFRGAKGGVTLAKAPSEVRLLDIVEACQGLVLGDYCQSLVPVGGAVCAFHRAMVEVHTAILDVLARWTLEDLVRAPRQTPPCKMAMGLP